MDHIDFPWAPDDLRSDVRIIRINGDKASSLDFSKLFVKRSDEQEFDGEEIEEEQGFLN